jgi:alkanesulfonate monooxygenase SsuD/methylene tetrahydromethanopterin reductase-like flavin-dependent oxidoreductase (luciferase family)
MGTFYGAQLTRFGFGDAVKAIREAWNTGGAKAGTEAVPAKLGAELAYIGDVQGAAERLKAQEDAGVNIHNVEIDAKDPADFEHTVAALVG